MSRYRQENLGLNDAPNIAIKALNSVTRKRGCGTFCYWTSCIASCGILTCFSERDDGSKCCRPMMISGEGSSALNTLLSNLNDLIHDRTQQRELEARQLNLNIAIHSQITDTAQLITAAKANAALSADYREALESIENTLTNRGATESSALIQHQRMQDGDGSYGADSSQITY